ncbi:hypothetical protein, partial [Loktanella sp. SALINAS62]|uniref:hypothetical protein n=1 Tax=Loktanella sp. SALINAS62 TaxID=2706124 RepID=UPI001B8BC30A
YHVRRSLQCVTVSETRMRQTRYTEFMTLPDNDFVGRLWRTIKYEQCYPHTYASVPNPTPVAWLLEQQPTLLIA